MTRSTSRSRSRVRRYRGINRSNRYRLAKKGYLGKPNVYPYKQAINGSYIAGIGSRTIQQAVGPAYYGLEFQAANLPNWAAFSALYDQYCITKIVIKLIPMLNMNGVQPLAAGSLLNPGIIATVIDTDDATAPSSLAVMEQYQSYKSQPVISQKTITRVYVPGVDSTVVAGGGAVVSAINKKLQWIDCAFGNIAHFGMKIYLDAYASANVQAAYQVQGFVYIKFRNVR